MSEKVQLIPKLKAFKENLEICKTDSYYGPVLKADKEIGDKFKALDDAVTNRLKEVNPEPRPVTGNAMH